MNFRVIAAFKAAKITYSFVELTNSTFPFAVMVDKVKARDIHECSTRSAAQALFLSMYRKHACDVRGYDETL